MSPTLIRFTHRASDGESYLVHVSPGSPPGQPSTVVVIDDSGEELLRFRAAAKLERREIEQLLDTSLECYRRGNEEGFCAGQEDVRASIKRALDIERPHLPAELNRSLSRVVELEAGDSEIRRLQSERDALAEKILELSHDAEEGGSHALALELHRFAIDPLWERREFDTAADFYAAGEAPSGDEDAPRIDAAEKSDLSPAEERDGDSAASQELDTIGGRVPLDEELPCLILVAYRESGITPTTVVQACDVDGGRWYPFAVEIKLADRPLPKELDR